MFSFLALSLTDNAESLHLVSPVLYLTTGVVADTGWSALPKGSDDSALPLLMAKESECVCPCRHAGRGRYKQPVCMCVMCHSDVRFIRLSRG